VSFAHSFDDAKAESRRHTQYFEMFGHRSIYHDGWRAVCPWPGTSFKEAGAFFGAPIDKDELTELDAKSWELYHVVQDFAENHNVADQNRPKLIEMIATWYVEAGKYNVLPIDSRGTQRFADERPKIAVDRKQFTVYPRTQGIPSNAIPSLLNRPHSITADVEIPKSGAQGVLLSQGGSDGGYSFYVQDGKLCYAYNYVGRNIYYVVSTEVVPTGRHELRFDFEVTGKADIAHGKGAPGKGLLYVDGKLVGQGDIPLTNPLSIGLLSTVICGVDPGAPVTPKYKSRFPFTGIIYGVSVDVSGELIRDHEAEVRREEPPVAAGSGPKEDTILSRERALRNSRSTNRVRA
jgi:arylsulfatase